MQEDYERVSLNRRSIGLWVGGVLLFAAVVGVALYSTWPMLFPEAVEMAPLDADCDLRNGPCTSEFPGGGTLRFSIEPRSLPLMQPLRLDVAADGLDVEAVEADFSGVDMNMGFNRVQLLLGASSGPVAATGQAFLPVCVRNRMAWEARVMVQTERGLLVAPFRFDTFRIAPTPE